MDLVVAYLLGIATVLWWLAGNYAVNWAERRRKPRMARPSLPGERR